MMITKMMIVKIIVISVFMMMMTPAVQMHTMRTPVKKSQMSRMMQPAHFKDQSDT